jgi:hypothetical protein
MFLRWRRMAEEDRRRVWRLYGWFSGLMCLGSVFGAVTWAAWMMVLALYFSQTQVPSGDNAQLHAIYAQYAYWYSVFCITYAIEFLCLSVAKLLVLDRIADFSVPKGDGMSRRLAVGGRAVIAVVVVGNVVGLCANVAAAVFFKQTGDFYSASSAAFAANMTDAGNNMNTSADNSLQIAYDAVSVQSFCEVAVLLIIIFAFAVVGIAGAHRLSSALANMSVEHGAAGRQLRRQIVGTASFVFVTFLLRAAFAIMNALANGLQNNGAACAATDVNPCDSSCYNVYAIMQSWLQVTPELQLSVVLISSPLALLVALWGMTSEQTLQHMRAGRGVRQSVSFRSSSVVMSAGREQSLSLSSSSVGEW